MAKKFKLKREYMNGGDVHLGGHRDNQPDRVTLTSDDPYVEGDAYEIYVPSILREVPQDPSVEEKSDALKKFAAKFTDEDSGDPEPEEKEDGGEQAQEEVEEKPDDVDIDTENFEEVEEVEVEDLLTDFENADAPQVEEGDELTLDSEDDEDGEPLPSVDELEDMNRSELEALALQMGVLDDIEGTGSGGYITVSDFNEHLAPLLEEEEDG